MLLQLIHVHVGTQCMVHVQSVALLLESTLEIYLHPGNLEINSTCGKYLRKYSTCTKCSVILYAYTLNHHYCNSVILYNIIYIAMRALGNPEVCLCSYRLKML